VNTWREELQDVIKSKVEREAEEQERRRKRVAEALDVALVAMAQSFEALRFAAGELGQKGQPAKLGEQMGEAHFELHGQTVDVTLDPEAAVVKISYNQSRAREFDFATDRHLAPKDVEEYVGRRLVELSRAVQKEHPW
jgi:uncharacterized protein YdbL (DUF1318 family)